MTIAIATTRVASVFTRALSLVTHGSGGVSEIPVKFRRTSWEFASNDPMTFRVGVVTTSLASVEVRR